MARQLEKPRLPDLLQKGVVRIKVRGFAKELRDENDVIMTWARVATNECIYLHVLQTFHPICNCKTQASTSVVLSMLPP